MPTRLILLSHPATAAMRQGRFSDDDALDARGSADAEAWRVHVTTLTSSDAGGAGGAGAGAGAGGAGDPHFACSPAPCAIRAAEIWGLEAQTTPALSDTHFGQWRGKKLADVAATAPSDVQAWTQDPSFAPPDGESFAMVRLRVAEWMEGLLAHSDVIAVTHAAVIRAALLHALDVPSATFARIDIPPLSMTELRHSRRGWSWVPGQ